MRIAFPLAGECPRHILRLPTMSLCALPVELLAHVFDFLDFPSHISLALTSKQLLWNSQDVLSANRSNHNRYNTCSDRDTADFQPLVKKLLETPKIGWFIRNVEIWNPKAANPSLAPEDHAREIGSFHDQVDLRMNDLDYEDILSSIEDHSNPEIWQLALFAKCPRIKSIKFLSFPPAPEDRYSRAGDAWINEMLLHEPDYYPHNYFSTSIRLLANPLPSSPIHSPFPLSTLTTLSLLNPFPNPPINANNIAPLFLLPALRTLYIRNLDCEDWDQGRSEYGKAMSLEGRSGVENLFLDGLVSSAGTTDAEEFLFEILPYHRCLRNLVIRATSEEFPETTLIGVGARARSLEMFLILPSEGSGAGGFPSEDSGFWYESRISEGMKVLGGNPKSFGAWKEGSFGAWEEGSTEGGMGGLIPEGATVSELEVVMLLEGAGCSRGMRIMGKAWRGLTLAVEEGVFPGLREMYADKYAMEPRGCGEGMVMEGEDAEAREAYEGLEKCCAKYGIRLFGFEDAGATDRRVAEICREIFDLSLADG